MANEKTLKRSKSLKNIIFRTQKAPSAADEELLPYRLVKHAFAEVQATSGGQMSGGQTRPQSIPEPQPQSPALSPRSALQRNTWPTSSKERKAGSYAFEGVPTLVRTPWELERASRRPQSHRAPPINLRPLPQRIFEQLPREIYHCILDQLETCHASETAVDVIGRQKDLQALLLVNKRWHRVAREHLYREIWAPQHNEPPRRTLSLQRSLTRLKQLQRTLKECEGLAHMTRHLRITADLAATLDSVDVGSSGTRRAAFEALAEVINLCPNLEYLSGYCPQLHDKISATLLGPLSTRAKLRAHVWNFRDADLRRDVSQLCTSGDILYCHAGWQHLETLAICATEDLQLGIGTVSAMIQRLPNLKHLMLSRLGRHDFHNGTLLSLPALRSLRLEHLVGITDQGVEQLAYARPALSLERLSLVGLELTSLRTVQMLLANMYRLRHLTVVQDTSPDFQPGMASAGGMKGLESPTLEYLHWDVLVAGSATALIANSIASGRFPALSKVKVPCDYDGAVQALCRPIAQEPLDANDLELIERFNTERYERFLRVAQIQAQLRIHESRQQPSFNVVVHDENKRVSATHVIGSYVGTMESQIEYSLEPDVVGSHYALIDFGDVEAPKWLYEKKNEMERSVQGEQVLDLRMLF